MNFNFYFKKPLATKVTLIFLPLIIALNLIVITRYFLNLEKIDIKRLEVYEQQKKLQKLHQTKIDPIKLQKWISYLNFPWVPLLEGVGKIRKSEPHIFILSIIADVNKKQIDITGETETFSDLNSFVLKLNESKLFKDVALVSHQSKDTDQINSVQTFLIKLFII